VLISEWGNSCVAHIIKYLKIILALPRKRATSGLRRQESGPFRICASSSLGRQKASKLLSRFMGCDYRRGYRIGFTDHLHTQLRTTSNYSAAAELYTLQFTVAPAKHFPACCVLTSRSLATASNSGASRAQARLSQTPPIRTLCQPSTALSTLNYPLWNSQSNSLLQLLTISLPSLLIQSSQLAWGLRYIAPRRTKQETPSSSNTSIVGR
jgi:hypothetical protein